MKRLVIDGFGKYIGRKGKRLVVKEKGSVVYQALPENLRQIVITGRGAVSIDAIRLLALNGVDVVFLNSDGRLVARLSFPEMRTVKTRREQYYAYRDKRGVHLAKEFALAKLRNQAATLRTLAKTRKDKDPQTAEKMVEAAREILAKIRELEEVEGDDIDSLRGAIMGLEGLSSAIYWSALEGVFPEDFMFEGRSGRYASDPVNAMLNYGYGILLGEVWRAIHFAGLDAYGGFLHADKPGKPSLVLDLMEEFRQQVVDKTVVRLASWGMVKPDDFEVEEGACHIRDKARVALVEAVLKRLESYIGFRGRRIRFCDIIQNQARSIARFLRGELSRYEGFWLRW